MSPDIDAVLRSLDIEADEPRVLVDPTLEAFCVLRSRTARGSVPPRPSSSGRIPLEKIIEYLRQNPVDPEPAG